MEGMQMFGDACLQQPPSQPLQACFCWLHREAVCAVHDLFISDTGRNPSSRITIQCNDEEQMVLDDTLRCYDDMHASQQAILLRLLLLAPCSSTVKTAHVAPLATLHFGQIIEAPANRDHNSQSCAETFSSPPAPCT
jgi:hypothetical protein